MIKVPKKVACEIQGKTPYDVAKLWFSNKFGEKLPETIKWLCDKPVLNNANKKLTFLISLLVKGYDIEEEEGVVFIDIPNSYYKYTFIKQSCIDKDKYTLATSNYASLITGLAASFTEEEAKDRFPNFRWVSLDDLESSERDKNILKEYKEK